MSPPPNIQSFQGRMSPRAYLLALAGPRRPTTGFFLNHLLPPRRTSVYSQSDSSLLSGLHQSGAEFLHTSRITTSLPPPPPFNIQPPLQHSFDATQGLKLSSKALGKRPARSESTLIIASTTASLSENSNFLSEDSGFLSGDSDFLSRDEDETSSIRIPSRVVKKFSGITQAPMNQKPSRLRATAPPFHHDIQPAASPYVEYPSSISPPLLDTIFDPALSSSAFYVALARNQSRKPNWSIEPNSRERYGEEKLLQYQEPKDEDAEGSLLLPVGEFFICPDCHIATFASQFSYEMHREFHYAYNKTFPGCEWHHEYSNYFAGRYRHYRDHKWKEELQRFESCSVIFTLPEELDHGYIKKAKKILFFVRVGRVYHLMTIGKQVELTFFNNADAAAFLSLVRSKQFLIDGELVTRACWSDNPFREKDILQHRSRVVDVKGSVDNLLRKFPILKGSLVSWRHVVRKQRNWVRLTYTSALAGGSRALRFLSAHTDFEVSFGPDPCDPEAELTVLSSNASSLDTEESKEEPKEEPKRLTRSQKDRVRYKKKKAAAKLAREESIAAGTSELKKEDENGVDSAQDQAPSEENFSAMYPTNEPLAIPSPLAGIPGSKAEVESSMNNIHDHPPTIQNLTALPSRRQNHPARSNSDDILRKGQRKGKLGRLDELLASSSTAFCLFDAIGDGTMATLSKNQQRKEARRRAKEQEALRDGSLPPD